MTFEWKEYSDLADYLFDAAADTNLHVLQKEALFRTAVSRSYYCVYNLLIEHTKQFPEKFSPKGRNSKKSDHEYLRDSIGDIRERDYQAIASDLGRLWTARIQADYYKKYDQSKSRMGTEISRIEKQVQKSLQEAKNIINALSRIDEKRTKP